MRSLDFQAEQSSPRLQSKHSGDRRRKMCQEHKAHLVSTAWARPIMGSILRPCLKNKAKQNKEQFGLYSGDYILTGEIQRMIELRVYLPMEF